MIFFWSFWGQIGSSSLGGILFNLWHILKEKGGGGKKAKSQAFNLKVSKNTTFWNTNKNNDEKDSFFFCFGILKCLLSPALKNNIILSIYVPKQFHKFNHHMFQHHLQPFKPLFFELMLTPVLDMDWMLMITTTLLLKILDKLGIGELVIKILRSCFAPLAGMFLEILFMHQSLLFFFNPIPFVTVELYSKNFFHIRWKTQQRKVPGREYSNKNIRG